ncbi:MAG: hypothetical protein J7K29_00225 [Candidatus Cloacimonetes bacterium]|nr:hypothetical protein [Candidatus Cloacimonadota bacterium]
MKKIILITLLIIAFSLNAEIINSAFVPKLLMPSIINMNNLTINHSMSFSSSISSNHQSAYESVYTNYLNYKFNSKLNLTIDLNFINYGSATYQSGIEFDSNHDNTSKVLPNFQLNYNPSENMSFTIEFRQFYSPFERNSLFN